MPIVDPNAPFREQTFQPLVAGTGYGVLRFVPGAELGTAPLGPDVIVITDEVPNDIPLVGGLITEAFQTPLAHVAVLSKNRGTPNMALLGAHTDARLAPFLGQLVRLEVNGGGFTVAKATRGGGGRLLGAAAPQGPARRPPPRHHPARAHRSARRQHRRLARRRRQGGADWRAVPAGQSGRDLFGRAPPCPTWRFGLPLVHSLEHFTASGAAAVLARAAADPAFAADPRVRARGLARRAGRHPGRARRAWRC